MNSPWMTEDVVARLCLHDSLEEALHEYATLSEYAEAWNVWQADIKPLARALYGGERGPWGHKEAQVNFAALRNEILRERLGEGWKLHKRPLKRPQDFGRGASAHSSEQGTPPGRGDSSPLGAMGSRTDDVGRAGSGAVPLQVPAFPAADIQQVPAGFQRGPFDDADGIGYDAAAQRSPFGSSVRPTVAAAGPARPSPFASSLPAHSQPEVSSPFGGGQLREQVPQASTPPAKGPNSPLAAHPYAAGARPLEDRREPPVEGRTAHHYIGEQGIQEKPVLYLRDARSDETKASLEDAFAALEEPFRSRVRTTNIEHSETTSVYQGRVENLAVECERDHLDQGATEHWMRVESCKRYMRQEWQAERRDQAYQGTVSAYATLLLEEKKYLYGENHNAAQAGLSALCYFAGVQPEEEKQLLESLSFQ